MTRWLPLALLFAACSGKETDTEPDLDTCGDIDGPDGEIPDVLGWWTGTFAQVTYYSNCTELDQADIAWLTGALQMEGYVPDGLRVTLDDNVERRLYGSVTETGGMVVSGVVPDGNGGIYHIALSGLVYHDQIAGRDSWQGGAYVAVDPAGDGTITCDARGSWSAFKSGT